MNVVGIIPARMASSRFPGKPLINIGGAAMIKHVYFRSRMATALDDVYIATCDQEIQEYCDENGMKVVMTKDTHTRASDRAAEAMVKIEELTGKTVDIPVMIQGDEPLLYPQMINDVVAALMEDETLAAANLMAALDSDEERLNPNVVKVVTDLESNALYFSRESIPSNKKETPVIPVYKQIAIIPFYRNQLIKFNELKEAPLEITESVDMLRFIENGCKVRMVLSEFNIYGVDTPEDLKEVENLMAKDELRENYLKIGKAE